MELLERLKVRLELTEDTTEDALLEDVILSAKEIFLSIRYPNSIYPTDTNGDPVIDKRWNGWILRCSIEIYTKIGAEGQSIHIENGINRHFEVGSISKSLVSEITPIVGITNANT